MAGPVRKSRVREVPPSEAKDDLSRFLREAEKQEIVITRNLQDKETGASDVRLDGKRIQVEPF